MKLQTKAPINVFFDDILTKDGKIKIDEPTQLILKSFLLEYKVQPNKWRQLVTIWYKNNPYVSLKDIDKTALIEFTIHFKLFLLGQLREIMDVEHKAFAELHGK
jgi:hypothetical protein